MSKHTLEQLLGSRVRVKILRFLYRNQALPFEISTLAKKVQEPRSTVTKEIDGLRLLGLVRRRY